MNYAQVALRSALAATVCLGLPSGVTFWRVILLRMWPNDVGSIAASILPDERSGLWAPLFVGGAALWGIALSRITHERRMWRMALACALAVFAGTSFAFSLIVEAYGLPPHLHFAFIFLAAGIANGVAMSVALGIVLRSWRLVLTLALGVGLVITLTILGVVLVLDVFGLRVGTGNLAMPTVAAWGTLAASLASGAMMGWVLAHHMARRPHTDRTETRPSLVNANQPKGDTV